MLPRLGPAGLWRARVTLADRGRRAVASDSVLFFVAADGECRAAAVA